MRKCTETHCEFGEAIGRPGGWLKWNCCPRGCSCQCDETIRREALLLSCFTPAPPVFLTSFYFFQRYTCITVRLWHCSLTGPERSKIVSPSRLVSLVCTSHMCLDSILDHSSCVWSLLPGPRYSPKAQTQALLCFKPECHLFRKCCILQLSPIKTINIAHRNKLNMCWSVLKWQEVWTYTIYYYFELNKGFWFSQRPAFFDRHNFSVFVRWLESPLPLFTPTPVVTIIPTVKRC